MFNGKFYKLSCLTTYKVFIGLTTITLEDEREKIIDMCSGKDRYDYEQIHYQYADYYMEILENKNYTIDLIECYDTNLYYELDERLDYWLDKIDNLIRPQHEVILM